MDYRLLAVLALTLAIGLAGGLVVTKAKQITAENAVILRDQSAIGAGLSLLIGQIGAGIALPWRQACVYCGIACLVMAFVLGQYLSATAKGDALSNRDAFVLIGMVASIILGIGLLIVGIAASVGWV